MQPEPSIALVLLNYNGKNYLQQNLPFLKKVSYKNKRIYVIDNASTDDSLQYLNQNYPEITIIRNSSNFGYAEGYNYGLAEIEAEYYVLLNTDVEVTENFLEPMLSVMQADKNVGICQPKILSIANRNLFEYAGAAGGWIDMFGYTFARGRVFDVCETDQLQYQDNSAIFWSSGACMMIQSSLFKNLNGFYGYFFMYYEEVDLCWRTILDNFKIVYCADSVVYHRETSLLVHQSPKRLHYLFRNNLIMLHRNLPPAEAFWIIPVRILLNVVSVLYFIVKGHFRLALSTTTAQFGYFKWWLFKSRNHRPGQKRSLRKMSPVYKGCIIYDYFVLHKKKFSDIVKTKHI